MGKTIRETDLGLILQGMQDKIAALEAQVRIGTFQAGDIRGTASATQLEGWLPCDGRVVKRSDFPALSAELGKAGYPYGAGDGSTTFGIPDLRGRVPIGAGTGTATGATAHALGQTPTSGAGGDEGHTHTHGVPYHSHDYTFAFFDNNFGPASSNAGMGAPGNHYAGAYRYTTAQYQGASADGGSISDQSGNPAASGAVVLNRYVTTGDVGSPTGASTGTTSSASTLQPITAVNFFIKI